MTAQLKANQSSVGWPEVPSFKPMSLLEPTKKLDLRQLPFDVLSEFVATILSTMHDSRRTMAGELSALLTRRPSKPTNMGLPVSRPDEADRNSCQTVLTYMLQAPPDRFPDAAMLQDAIRDVVAKSVKQSSSVFFRHPVSRMRSPISVISASECATAFLHLHLSRPL